MPQSALSRCLATIAVAVALVGAMLTAPTAQAADGRDRALAPHTASRAVLASRALTRAEAAMAGRGGDATMALRDLHVLKDALSPADQARAARLSARPATNKVDCGSKIACVHWQTGETTGPWAKLVKATVTKVGKTYRKAGYRSPKKDGHKGGNKKTDIYVDDLQPGLYGYCTIDNGTKQPGPGRFDVPAFCVVDNNYKGFPTNTPKENLQVTVAHEFFHAVQFAYDFYEDPWLMEASAAWVEDEVYDKVNDNLQYLKYGQLAKPRAPMDKFSFNSYGHWIFFRYLSETFTESKGRLPTVLLDIWKAADSSHGSASDQFSTQAINTALAARGTSFAREFAKFADVNRRSHQFYSEGKANKYPVAPLTDGAALDHVGAAGTITDKLKHLTTSTFQLRSQGIPDASTLALNFDIGDAVQGAQAVVTVYLKSGPPVVTVVPLDASGVGSYQAPFGSNNVSSVEITISNASLRYSKCYTNKTPYACGGGKPTDDGVNASVAFQVISL